MSDYSSLGDGYVRGLMLFWCGDGSQQSTGRSVCAQQKVFLVIMLRQNLSVCCVSMNFLIINTSIFNLQKLHFPHQTKHLTHMISPNRHHHISTTKALQKHTNHNRPFQSINNIYEHYLNANTQKIQNKHIVTLIKICYNHPKQQQELTTLLKLPFLRGPIAINSFPPLLISQIQQHSKNKEEHPDKQEEQNQLQFLISYLNSVKEYYFCWVIYFNESQKQLRLKLMKKNEIEENQGLFNVQLNLIGIFIKLGNKDRVENANKDACTQYYTASDGQFKSTASFNNSTGISWQNMVKSKSILKINKEKQKSLSKLKALSAKYKTSNKKHSTKIMQQSFHKTLSLSVSIKAKSKSHISPLSKTIKREEDVRSNAKGPLLRQVYINGQVKGKGKLRKQGKGDRMHWVSFKR